MSSRTSNDINYGNEYFQNMPKPFADPWFLPNETPKPPRVPFYLMSFFV